MEMQIPDLSSLGRAQQAPSVPLFMLKIEVLKAAAEALPFTDEKDVTALADKFLLYVMSPTLPEARDETPASLDEEF
jgi:hypothetical protein